MNKYLSLSGILVLLFFMACSHQEQPNTTDEILSKVKQNLQDARYLTFHTEVKTIDLSSQDTTAIKSGTRWMKRQPADSIFGSIFHMNSSYRHYDDRFDGGVYRSGEVDYYYDGEYSLEIHHRDSTINIFDPYKYPNTLNNPAKARSALFPFKMWHISRDIDKKLLAENPKDSLYKEDSEWILKLQYPENEVGQKLTRKIHINPSGWFITKVDRKIEWKGKNTLRVYRFSEYSTDSSQIAGHIPLQKQYAAYDTKYPAKEREQSKKEPTKFEQLVGKQAPSFSYPTYQDRQISLSDFEGQFVLLDFWETWCGYCIIAFPKINKLYKKFEDKSFTIIGITTENREAVRTLIDENDLAYPNLKADQQIVEDYHVRGRPAYVLINPSGKIVATSYGDLDMMIASYPGDK